MDMWGVNYMLVILKFLCTDVFIEVKLMFSLLELLLFLREGRVRCWVFTRVGTVEGVVVFSFVDFVGCQFMLVP